VTPDLFEVNFDGLVGPTHHFGGLGVGNLASQTHGGQVAKPRAAAIQGIEKIRRCVALGARQAFLPPQRKPSLTMLRRLGFRGNASELLKQAADTDPHLLSAVWSASSMWTANAATVSEGSSSADGKTHLTIANLSSSLHRSIEPAQTLRLFRSVFAEASFVIHRPLPSSVPLRDEGAANHMRLTDSTGTRGIDLFVYGSHESNGATSHRFFARQGIEASRAVARLHGLNPANTFFLLQHPEAINAGAFHNDVVATSHRHVWLHHEKAYLDASETIASIENRFFEMTGEALIRHEISDSELPLSDAIKCYLFNGQLLSRDHDSSMTLLCPEQVRETPLAMQVIETTLKKTGPLRGCEFVELRESMNNGGGPACLRLRVPMSPQQWDALPESLKWSDETANDLCEVFERLYPETLAIADLANVEWIKASEAAVNAIERILGLSLGWNLASSDDPV